jgi:hypothetical protein
MPGPWFLSVCHGQNPITHFYSQQHTLMIDNDRSHSPKYLVKIYSSIVFRFQYLKMSIKKYIPFHGETHGEI